MNSCVNSNSTTVHSRGNNNNNYENKKPGAVIPEHAREAFEEITNLFKERSNRFDQIVSEFSKVIAVGVKERTVSSRYNMKKEVLSAHTTLWNMQKEQEINVLRQNEQDLHVEIARLRLIKFIYEWLFSLKIDKCPQGSTKPFSIISKENQQAIQKQKFVASYQLEYFKEWKFLLHLFEKDTLYEPPKNPSIKASETGVSPLESVLLIKEGSLNQLMRRLFKEIGSKA